MEWAMSDYNIDGKIFSIDILPNNEPWSRPIDYGDGIMIENLSNREVWKVLSKPKWQEKIETISGYSGQVISKNNFLDADFAYIDGGHFYEAVKHDFYSFLKNSNKKFSILFDDYIERESYGVKDFVDNEISKWFEVELIDTDPDHLLYKKNRTKNNEYGMCLISSESMNTSKDEILNSIEKDVMKYRRFEKRMIMRGKLNKKLPFLKNHKLSFWK